MPFGVAKHEDWQAAEEVIRRGSAMQLLLDRRSPDWSRNGVAGKPQSGLGLIGRQLVPNRIVEE